MLKVFAKSDISQIKSILGYFIQIYKKNPSQFRLHKLFTIIVIEERKFCTKLYRANPFFVVQLESPLLRLI